MATAAGTVNHEHTSDATFRVWAQALHAVITTFLTDTAATGSVDLTTMSRPGTNAYAGFKVYRFNDALQASCPVFLKVEYGTGVFATNGEIRVTAGTAHDGSGTLTGTQVTTAARIFEIGGAASVTYQYYASGHSGRFSLGWGLNNDGLTTGQVLSLERTKDASGADDSTGIVLAFAGGGGNANQYRTHVLTPIGGMPPSESRWMMPFAKAATSVYDAKAAPGLMIPFAGVALRPLISWGMINATDYPVYGATIAVTVYGTSRTYIAIGSASRPNSVLDGVTVNAQNVGRLLMLYE